MSSSGTISTKLTDVSFVDCMNLNMRLLFTLSFTILLICLFISCLNSMFATPQDYDISYRPVSMRGNAINCSCRNGKCKCKRMEYENFMNITDKELFSNDSFYSFKLSKDARYQSIPLLDPENKAILFGKAQRYVFSQNDKMMYRLDIDSNLYVLDGNVYDSQKVDQKYDVILHNSKTNKNLHIGNLQKDGDGMYKLSFVSNDKIQELADYDTLRIFYTINNKANLILSGTFL
jgi:hypothetical protein